MFDQTTIADNVSRWTGLGVTLPKELAKAVEVFEAVRYTEVGYTVAFDIEDVSPANAENKIREFAEQLVVSTGPDGGPGLSALQRAKNLAVDAAARRVNKLARAAMPDVIEQLTPAFDEHARAYVDAVATLPDNLTAETLLAAGADAVSAYGDAQREAQYLGRVSSWVAQTDHLSGFIPRDVEVVLRILRPQSALELTKLDAAHHKQANPTLLAVGPVLFTAARLGVQFGINTLREAADLRKSLAIRPQKLSGVPTTADFR